MTTKLEQLKVAYMAATPGEWKPCREHEEFDGPMYDIDIDEEPEYAARPYVRICSPLETVTTNHDLFVFKPGNAEFIALAHNNMPLLLEAVEILGKLTATPSNPRLIAKAYALLEILR